MATTTLKGKVMEVGPITQVGDKKTDLQSIIVFVPGYHDGFEKKGRDNLWAIQILGDKVKNLNIQKDLVDKIITCICYLDSQFVEPKLEGQTGFYSVNVTLASFIVTDK